MNIRLAIFAVTSILAFYNSTAQSTRDIDKLYNKSVRAVKRGDIDQANNLLQAILIENPKHLLAHELIIQMHAPSYTSIPLVAAYRILLNDYKAENNKTLLHQVAYISKRFITVTDTGNVFHVAPYFIRNWDSDFDNNVSSMEAIFIMTGTYDMDKKYLDSLNIAERQVEKFDLILKNYDTYRKKYHGFYWDFYFDYFNSLYKSEHLKTACYLIYYMSEDATVKKWVDTNTDKVEAFLKWDENELGLLIKRINTTAKPQ